MAYQTIELPFDWEEVSEQYIIKNYTVKDGLPINSANYMHHNSDGFIYIATTDGLARFDGNRFVVFNTANSSKMQSNRIIWLAEGKSGELWLLDTNRNLYLLKGDNISWFQEAEKYRDVTVEKLNITQKGTVIINTNIGLLRQKNGIEFESYPFSETKKPLQNSFGLDGEKLDFITENGWFTLEGNDLKEYLSANVLEIAVDNIFNMISTKDGTKWLLGFNNTLLKVTPQKEQTLYTFEDSNNIRLWDLKEISESQLILSTEKGYLFFNRKTGSFTPMDSSVTQEEYFEDNAWVHFEDKLITKKGNKVFINDKLVLETERQIVYLGLDKENSIWVITNGSGIYKIAPQKMITIGENVFPGLMNVYGLDVIDNEIWAVSFQNNMFRITDNRITNWSELADPFYRSILAKNPSEVYAGNFDLWEYNNSVWEKSIAYEAEGELIDAIFIDSKNRFWIGTDKSLQLKNDAKFLPFTFNDGSQFKGINMIKEFKDIGVFFGTNGDGVIILDENEQLQKIGIEQGISSNLIRDVHKSAKDTLWIVTEDKGLNRVLTNKNNSVVDVVTITVQDGLIDNSLHRLIRDEYGYFWINSNKGIMRINEKVLNDYIDGKTKELLVQNFTDEDGLSNIEGNGGTQNAGILTSDGKLLFPNQEGIIYTRPEWHVNENQTRLVPPVFESVITSDTTISLIGKKAITLSKESRDFQIRFTLPTFKSMHNLDLEYKLDGVNTSWQNAGLDRLASFTNLNAGEHIFKVRGKLLNSKQYSEEKISIFIEPYFYEKKIFQLLFLFAIAVLISTGIKVLLFQAKRREEKLNTLVNKRTEELLIEKERTEKALSQIKKLDESKSQFFTNFTHELRTPLSLILGPLEEMFDNVADNKTVKVESLNLMIRNANRLKHLVNQLLDVSKLNSGEIALEFEKIDLMELTNQIVGQFEYSLTKKALKIEVSSNKRLEPIYMDANAWDHICTNLLSNAIKFTPENGHISISFEDADHTLTCIFSDTGIGISELDLPNIFKSYYQGENNYSKVGGTGIGLALTKGLLEQIGGEITVDSKLGKGATFKISLPKKEVPSNLLKNGEHRIGKVTELYNSIIEPLELKKPAINDLNLSSANILLVEDNDDFRSYLSSILRKTYTVTVAMNGKHGLAVLKDFKPDIIISDIMMPEMDGYEMMKEIRKMELYKHIPFIFLSAKDSNYDVEKGLNAGADIYLTKPIQNKLLLTHLKAMLRREVGLRSLKNAPTQNNDTPLVKKTKEIIHRHLGNPDLNVELIAESLMMSSSSLYRKWRDESDESINQLITKIRFEEALKLIKEENVTISEASYAVGFSQLSYFSRAFKKVYSISPQEYLKKEKSLQNT